MRALDTEFALSKRVHLTLAEITLDEWYTLRIIEDERSKAKQEESLTIPKLPNA